MMRKKTMKKIPNHHRNKNKKNKMMMTTLAMMNNQIKILKRKSRWMMRPRAANTIAKDAKANAQSA